MALSESLVAALATALLAAAMTSAHVASVRRSAPTSPGQASTDPCSATGSLKSWPENTLPYTISSSVPDSLRLSLQQAIHKLELVATCILFVPRTSQKDYVLFEHGKSCCSHPGVANIGMQRVYVDESCGEDGLLDTLARLTGQDYTINDDGQLVFNDGSLCQGICGSVLELSSESHGTLQSPGFPDNYPPDQECSWKFWLTAGSKFSMKFLTFDLESDQFCLFDYVELIEQNSAGLVTSFEKLCNELLPFTFNSSGSVVSIRFHTDFDVQESGFNATYFTSGINLTTGRGVPFNECSVNNYSNCTNGGHENGPDQNNGRTCPSGYQLAADNISCTDVNECDTGNGGCNQRCKNTEGSFYCHCKVGYGLGPGLQTCIDCGEVLNSTSGDIYSPAFPGPYPPHQNCKWQVQRRPETYFRVTLTNMDIKSTHKCTEDYLKPSEGHFKNSRRLCGYYSQIQYIIKSDEEFWLRFHTNSVAEADSATGFHLHYDQVPVSNVSENELNFVFINGVQVNYHSKNWLA